MIAGFFGLYTNSLVAQVASRPAVKTVLDPSPVTSARAAGMGGTLSTIADGGEASYYNPAAIGGIHWEGTPPDVRELYFPQVSIAANEHAADLAQKMFKEGATGDSAIGQAIVDAQSTDRQYARTSQQLSLTWKRLRLGYFNDVQLAAVKREDLDEGSGNIETKFQNRRGIRAGISATDSKERFYLGLSSNFEDLNQISGTFSYIDFIDQQRRSQITKTNGYDYTGVLSHAGLIWVVSKQWRPSLALVVHDVGDTHYKLKKFPEGSPESAGNLKVPQDYTLGFSISPNLGKWGHLSYVVEAGALADQKLAVNRKMRTAAELSLGSFGSRSWFALRSGYNSGTYSVGGLINLGLIQLEFASQGQEVGIDNHRIQDRRYVITLAINVLDE
jgi:hypothetical protein